MGADCRQMSEVNRTYLSVEGMHCSSCAQTVERALNDLGLQDVSVDFATSRASFALPRQHSLEAVKETIERIGYRVISGDEGTASPWWQSIEAKFIFCLVWTLPLAAHMVSSAPVLHNPWLQLALTIPVFTVGLLYFGRSAWSSVRAGSANMDVLIIIGVVAAFVYSLYGTLLGLGHNFLFYETAATIITIVLFGNVLEKRSVRKTTTAIRELSSMQVTRAKRITEDGGQEHITEIDSRDVRVGDLLLVNMGDRVPADGTIESGEGLFDESMITGESIPVEKSAEAHVVGGTILSGGSIRMRASAVGDKTVLAHIVRLVQDAQSKRPSIQRIGDKVSSIFVPAVLLISLTTLALTYGFTDLGFGESLLRAIAVLVVACPCAMGLATPTAVMVALGKAARSGILVKGGDTLERCAEIQKIIFDKTGTLTTGDFTIEKIDVFAKDIDFVKDALVSMEEHSSHPIAKSLIRELGDRKRLPLRDIQEIKGLGISAFYEGKQLRVGSKLLLPPPPGGGHDLYLFEDDDCLAGVKISDQIKPGAESVIRSLRERNIEPVLLSGDRQEKCRHVAEALDIKEMYAEQQPEDKVEIIDRIERELPTAFVGDGVNDAPSLSRARVGISLSNATQAAVESAHIILLNGDLTQIERLVDLSRLTMRTIKQNLFWAFFYNVLMIPLAAIGMLTPTLAAFSMAFSDVIVIANSLRLRLRQFAKGA